MAPPRLPLLLCCALHVLAARVTGSPWDDFDFRRANITAPPAPPPNPWRTNNYGFDCTPSLATAPLYGAASTLAGGYKLCPFDPESSVCTTAVCYFYRVEVTNNVTGAKSTRMCPTQACDALIKDWCDKLKLAGRRDMGCQVLTRPPWMPVGTVGIGPFVDWLEELPVKTVDDYPQAPANNIVKEFMPGGMSSKELKFTLAGTNFAANQAAFIAAVATTLSIPKNYVVIAPVPIVSAGSTQVTVQIIGNKVTGSVASKFSGSIGGMGISGAVAEKDVDRTGLCFGMTPKKVCPIDPNVEKLKTSRVAMSGVWSIPVSKIADDPGGVFGELMEAGFLVGAVLVLTCAIIWISLSCG